LPEKQNGFKSLLVTERTEDVVQSLVWLIIKPHDRQVKRKVRETFRAGCQRQPVRQRRKSPSIAELSEVFSLPWSAYVRLLVIKDDHAREFFELEAVRGGWSVRQLDRQINSQFYERTVLSRNKAAMLEKGAGVKPEDVITAEDAIKRSVCPGVP